MVRMPLEERRRALIDAALTVIARDGLAAASVRAIVAEAGMPLGAFHFVFDSREHLLAAAIAQVTEEERQAAFAGVDAVPLGARLEDVVIAGLGGFVDMIVADDSSERALMELALHAARHDHAAVSEQWAMYRAAAAMALDQVAERCGVRWTRPIDVMARRLVSVTDTLTLTWFIDRDAEALHADVRDFARLFVAASEPL